MQGKRDLLVQDIVGMMERHFDGSELSGVVAEVDKTFRASLRSAREFTRDRQAAARGSRWFRRHRPWVADAIRATCTDITGREDSDIPAPAAVTSEGMRQKNQCGRVACRHVFVAGEGSWIRIHSGAPASYRTPARWRGCVRSISAVSESIPGRAQALRRRRIASLLASNKRRTARARPTSWPCLQPSADQR